MSPASLTRAQSRVAEAADDALRLRCATQADVPAAAAIIRDALAAYGLSFEPDGRDADVNALGTRADHDDLVVELGGKLVGIASVGPHGDVGVAWVSKVFVATNARRAGVGRALLSAVHNAARARGYRRVGLRTRVVFLEAISLYESEGYARAGTEGTDIVYFRTLSSRDAIDTGT